MNGPGAISRPVSFFAVHFWRLTEIKSAAISFPYFAGHAHGIGKTGHIRRPGDEQDADIQRP
ncbi:hypothetical protein CUJ84_Chr003755 [Rhizobium leguminosarum]|uniref:Uncharacterized protein n=1 Tax=Rhizobium leguminosarum TaxID=384 RepID=A0A2K9Z786_RHILE|nr:hypothetical protein CUJ84_Chr003755 [Rhizobium leguminosarum]